MTLHPLRRLLAVCFSLALLAVGCGQSDSPDATGGSGGGAGGGAGGSAGAGGTAGMAGAGGMGGTGGVILMEIDRDLSNAETLPCNYFTSARTLARRTDAVDYVVPAGCVMDVTADVIVEAGVIIAVEDNGGIGVYDAGSFRVDGTAEEPVAIVGAVSGSGRWRGIHIESNELENQLRHLRIEDAGSNYVYCCNEVASVFNRGGRMSLRDVIIRRGSGYGIVARATASFDAYSNVRITQHVQAPLRIAASRTAELDGIGSDYSSNLEDFVELDGTRVSSPSRIPAINVPYRWDEGVIDITDALTVDAGVEIAFGQNAGLGVYDAGSLSVNGTSTNRVVFEGTAPMRGWWRGVHLETNAASNRLRNLEIRHAGSNYVYCCNERASLFLDGGQMSVEDTTIADGDGFGIYVDDDFSFGDFSANTITGHSLAPLSVRAVNIDDLDGLGSSFSGNADDHIHVRGSAVDQSIRWLKTDIPYLVEEGRVLDLRGPVDIQAGTEIVFGENSGIGVYDNGSFSVGGTSAEPVIFRGFLNSQGFWRGIHTETNSSANVITYAQIRHAGSNYVYCCNEVASLFVRSGRMTIQNSSVTDSGGCGIYQRTDATLTESANTYSNNADGNVCQE